ncbi:formyltransferase family protein [Streptomyces halstedii]|uniref:formyltransferase family protein n=1 Tax=Streptomyces halstedii TaxID=1944 RepID=UPI00368FC440
MNIFISGRGAFAVQVAEALDDAGHTLLGAASPALRKGRTDDADPMAWDRVRAWAFPRDIPWTEASELREHHIPEKADIIVAAHSHAFIGRRTRARAGVAVIGYHPSLLPLHRGRDAIRWAIRDGDKVTGGSVYHLTERTDGGPVAAQEHVLIPPDATAESLWREHLAPLGVRLLLRVVNDLANDVRIEVPQDEKLATWEPSMDSAPLYKPELIALPGNHTSTADKWALIER